MAIDRIFELTMILDSDRFKNVLDNALGRSEYIEDHDGEYVDYSVCEKGLIVIYRASQYKKKVRLLVNDGIMLGNDKTDPDKLIRKLRKRIEKYFGFEYSINDFVLTGVTLINDIDVGSREKVSAYLKVLKRIGKVKGFSPARYGCLDHSVCFCFSGNSNGIDFMLYDLENALLLSSYTANASRRNHKAVSSRTTGILRAEVRLTKPKAIRHYTDALDLSGQITELTRNSIGIFMDVFTRIIPHGDMYKKDKAADIIRSKVKDSKMRRRMLRLLALIPEKKSLLLAQKAMNCRDVEKVMEAFARIKLSPVTIGKRQDDKFLKCFYEFLSG